PYTTLCRSRWASSIGKPARSSRTPVLRVSPEVIAKAAGAGATAIVVVRAAADAIATVVPGEIAAGIARIARGETATATTMGPRPITFRRSSRTIEVRRKA